MAEENDDTTAAEDDEAQRLLDDAIDDDKDQGEPNGDEGALGDAGKKAIDAMKAKWQKERDSRKALQAQLAELQKPKGDQPDPDAIRAEAARDATTKANERIIRSEIRAAAAGKLKDPKDALAHLDISKFEVDDDGNVDEDEIADAISDLLEKKPYLGVAQREEKRFQGGADGGARGKAGKPQLTRDDVERLAKEGKHAEIDQARVEGRLNDLLGIK